MSKFIRSLRHGAVLEIRIDRPERKNAMLREMYLEIARLLDEAGANAEVRAVLLSGQPDIFCAGNDLSEFINPSGEGLDAALIFMRSMYTFEKPLIAAAAGHAVGIGATLLLQCDLVYAGDSAKLSFPFLLLGACPEFGSTRTLTRVLGHQRAMEVFLFGAPLDATKLLNFGLVNEVVNDSELLEHALGKAAQLAALPSEAVASTKSLLRQSEPDMLALFEEESRQFVELLKSQESQAAISRAMNRK